MRDTLDSKYAKMQEILRSLRSVAVAFSGGVDSTFVLRVSVDVLGLDKVVAVTANSDSLAAREKLEAEQFAASLGVEHVLIETSEFENESYLQNPPNRCYFCKTTLYACVRDLVRERGLDHIVCGTNVDDLGDYRPGLAAAKEHGVRAPAAEAGLTKNDIRALLKGLGLSVHDKPASPCLSSRVQYGERITPEKLRMIEEGEQFLRGLGMRECRVRHHDGLARIEVSQENIPILSERNVASRIDRFFRELGYRYVALDLRGLRSGSMNEVLPLIQVGVRG